MIGSASGGAITAGDAEVWMLLLQRGDTVTVTVAKGAAVSTAFRSLLRVFTTG